MNFKEYKEHLKDEWDFHKSNPELFLVWATYAWSLYIFFSKN